jgi:cytidine deaminase
MSEAADRELVEAAKDAIVRRYRPDWHVVGAALRLRSGQVFSGVHLEANVGRIAVCAEAIALGRAVTEAGSSDVETIVAVYHRTDGRVVVVAPCGMCREMISDYSPGAVALVPGDDQPFARRSIAELLPAKYTR